MEKMILGLAIVLGVFFRVWQVGQIPSGMAMDEAAFGYNAWSMATNLRDEYGKFLPLAFRSFADFKLPAYGYLTAGVVYFFGPGVWQTRTVSVLAGLLSCLLLYAIVFDITKRKKLAALSGLLMLWSPWGIIFARGAFEGNLGLAFFLLGVLGLAKARKDARFLFLAALGFSLANYSYITYKFVGIMTLTLWTIGYRKTHRFSVTTICALLVFLLLSAPTYLMFSGISGSNRIGSLLKLNPIQTGYPAIVQLTANYLTYFSPRNLFFRPDPVRQRHFAELSTFYPWMFILWLIGGYLWFKERKTESAKWVGIGLLICPIPAAISQDPFATLRAIPMLPAYCVVLAWGAEIIAERLKKERAKQYLYMTAIVLMSESLYAALMIMKHGQIAEWNGGIDRLAVKLAQYDNRPIFVDIPRDVYPNLALALKFPPIAMQQARANFDLSQYYTDPVFPDTVKFGRYQIGKTDRSAAQTVKGAILVARPEDVFANEAQSRHWKEAFAIADDSGKLLFLAFELN